MTRFLDKSQESQLKYRSDLVSIERGFDFKKYQSIICLDSKPGGLNSQEQLFISVEIFSNFGTVSVQILKIDIFPIAT